MNDSKLQTDLIGQRDIVFVLDTTSSMGPFINAAKEHIRLIAQKAIKEGELSLRMAIVEYRDHPPEETSFITKVHQFEGNIDSFQQTLEGIGIHGGGDEAEAVYDGVIQATKLAWREHASRNIWLVGDSPPHGGPHLRYTASKSWIQGCPCGDTEQTCLEALKERKITINAITLAEKDDLKEAFENLANGTNGEFSHRPGQAQQAMSITISDYFDHTTADVLRDRTYHTTYTAAAAAGTATDAISMSSVTGIPVADILVSHEDLVARNIITEDEDEEIEE